MLLLPKPEEQPHKHQREERETEKAGNTHTLLPATLFPCPAWLHSKSFQFVKESLQRDMHQNHFFVWGIFVLARKRYFNLLVWWESERERGGGGICCTAIRNICKKSFCIFFPFLFYITATAQKLRLRLDFPASTSPHMAMTGSL